MRYLLDTNIWLRMHAQPDLLSESCRSLLVDLANELVFSSVVSWEIAIKHRIGKLTLPSEPEQYVPDRLRTVPMTRLPVDVHHSLRVASLDLHHADPFDRLLIAQALCEGLPVITADSKFDLYPITVVPA